MVDPCPAVSFLTPKLKPLKSTAPRVDAPARRLLKLPEFNWGQIPIVFVWFVLFALWERRPRRDEALQTTTHRPGGGAPTGRNLAEHHLSPRGRGSYKMQGNPCMGKNRHFLVGATPSSR